MIMWVKSFLSVYNNHPLYNKIYYLYYYYTINNLRNQMSFLLSIKYNFSQA